MDARNAAAAAILVADAERFRRRVTALRLEHQGYLVTSVATYPALDAALRGAAFDLVLVDANLLGAKSRAARPVPATADTRVIVYAVAAPDGDAPSCLATNTLLVTERPMSFAAELLLIGTVLAGSGHALAQSELDVDLVVELFGACQAAAEIDSLIARYAADARGLAAQARLALETHDMPTARAILHRLKGCVMAVGGRHLDRMLKDAESTFETVSRHYFLDALSSAITLSVDALRLTASVWSATSHTR
ncbi:MAG: hypothetical protein HYX63_08665 [Gammaproteobacteria bacterium]|nr:hypothetical protein [Gammaproteobacteria bacterium]